MTDQTNASNAAAAEPTPEEKARNDATKLVQNLRREYVAPGSLADNVQRIGSVMQATQLLGLPLTHNYDPSEEIPEGYGIGIIPIPRNKGATEKREVCGVCIGIVPDVTLVRETDGGEQFMRDNITRALLGKLANAVRGVIDNEEVNPPATVADFITNARAAESLDAFNKVHVSVLAALKQTGLTGLNKGKFRRVLEIAAYAEQMYPNVAQTQWEGVIDMLLNLAADAGMDPGAMASWKRTRTAATQASTDTFDLTALNAALGGGDAGEADDGTEPQPAAAQA